MSRGVTVQRNPLRERDIHILNFKDEADGRTTLHGARDIAHWILVCEKKDKACPSSHPAPAPLGTGCMETGTPTEHHAISESPARNRQYTPFLPCRLAAVAVVRRAYH